MAPASAPLRKPQADPPPPDTQDEAEDQDQLLELIASVKEELEKNVADGFAEQKRGLAELEGRLAGRLRVLKEGARAARDVRDLALELSSAVLALRNALDHQASPGGPEIEAFRGVESRLAHVQARLETHLEAVEAQASAERAKLEPGFERFFALVQPVVAASRTLLDYDRLHTLWYAAHNAAPLGLPSAEIGAYRGGSAFFLASALRDAAGGELPLQVFDTFSGHVRGQLSDHDSVHHARPVFEDTDAQEVTEYLEASFDEVQVHVGDVLEQLPELEEQTYGLVHLDVDIYEPTLACLRYFAPRLAVGGVIVVDDFGAPKCPGIARAVGAFRDEDDSIHAWPTRREQILLIKVREASAEDDE